MLQIKNDAMYYTIQQSDLVLAERLAADSQAKYSSKVADAKSPYRQNTLQSHLMGKIGEVAVAQAFKMLKQIADWPYVIDEVYLDPIRDAQADLIINSLRIEVKTWRPWDIQAYGYCVAERQALKLHKKADVIVYGSYNKYTNEYIIHGFNSVGDLRTAETKLTGPADDPSKQVLNRIMSPRPIIELPIADYVAA